MKISLKGKSIIKKIALALAGVAALTAVGFGVKAIVDYTKDDLKAVTLSYDVGNLGTDGKFVDDEGTLYTKDAFACYGLQVKPDFDSTVNYQIFYYDILDNYISSTEIMSDGYSGESPLNGAYARLVIEPRDDEDGKISLTERVKYSKQLTVKVKKEQKIDDRYTVFNGKIMGVVTDISELVFTKSLFLDEKTLTWGTMDNRCTTTSVLLKVDGGEKITYNFSKLDENYRGSYCFYSEFKGFPLENNIVCINDDTNPEGVHTFAKATKYVMITVDTGSGLEWNDDNLLKLLNCFSLSK